MQWLLAHNGQFQIYGHAQANISIRISPEFGSDKAASGLEVVVPMPREVQRVSCDNLKPSQAHLVPEHQCIEPPCSQ